MSDLAAAKHLHTLGLRYAKVTGATLKELAGLKRLRTLIVRGSGVTDAGLKDCNGHCRIVRSRGN